MDPIGEFTYDRESFLNLHLVSLSTSGLCSREWYEFRRRISVTCEHWRGDSAEWKKERSRAITLLCRMDWQAFWLTFRLAVIVTAVLLVLGLPLAYWIAFSRWRWKFLGEAGFAPSLRLSPPGFWVFLLFSLGGRRPPRRSWESMDRH